MWAWAAVILLLTHACTGGLPEGKRQTGREELPAHKRQSVQYSTLVGPSFLNTSLHAHTHALIGQTAYLTCVVRNLHNYTVSWVRARDIHLLTAGETTYTSDHRFVAVNPGAGSRWMLRLHHARPSDAGTYLCQVSVSPPMSTTVTLLVTEAITTVHPGREVYLKAGSRVVLVCEVRGCPYPALVTWYRGRQVQEGTEVYESHVKAGTVPPSTTTHLAPTAHSAITPFSEGGQGAPTSTPVSTTTPTPTPIGLPIARITLTRPRASAAHSGLYTCTNTCTTPVNLTLHVLIGDEETAAMQHLSGSLRLLPAVGGAIVLLTPLVTSLLSQHLMS